MPEESAKHTGWAGPRAGRGGQEGENRWPPALATLVAIAVYWFLPESLVPLPRLVIPLLELALLVCLLITNPMRMSRQSRWSRWASIALSSIVIVSNLVALGLLVAHLGSDADGSQMLLGAMEVWLTGVIGFATLYWEMDRGGPVTRRKAAREELQLADWRFSQDENHDAVREVKAGSSVEADWMPHFADYLYLSITNSSAFSPTDTMPLSSRAKMLMGLQATAALLTSLLVVARAVGAMG